MKFSALNIFFVFLFTSVSVSCSENKSRKTSKPVSSTPAIAQSHKTTSAPPKNTTAKTPQKNKAFSQNTLLSMPWKNGDTVPAAFIHSKAGGKNHSPKFSVKTEALPNQTKFLLLVMVDHHKVAHDWIHWIALVPSSITSIPENASANPPKNMEQYQNSWGNPKYEGPLPPPGAKHDYHFVVYALRKHPDFSRKPSWQEITQKTKPVLLKKWEVTAYFGR